MADGRRWSTVMDPVVGWLRDHPDTPFYYADIAEATGIVPARRVATVLSYILSNHPELAVRRVGTGIYAWVTDTPPSRPGHMDARDWYDLASVFRAGAERSRGWNMNIERQQQAEVLDAQADRCEEIGRERDGLPPVEHDHYHWYEDADGIRTMHRHRHKHAEGQTEHLPHPHPHLEHSRADLRFGWRE
jgi:hypothetical protein